MAALRDLLFSAGILKKAATTDVTAPPAQVLTPAQPSGIDIAAEAQKAAARSRAPVKPAPPPATAPVRKKNATAIGTALKSAP